MQCTIIRNSNEHNIAKILANNTARGISYPAPRTTQPYSGGTEMEIMVVCLFCWCFGCGGFANPESDVPKKISSLPAKQTSAAFVCPPSDVSTHLPLYLLRPLFSANHPARGTAVLASGSGFGFGTRQYNTGNSNREKVKEKAAQKSIRS
jgi:hypothetical protein